MTRFGASSTGILALVLASVLGASHGAISDYIKPDDTAAADLAKKAKDLYCDGDFRGDIDRVKGRKDLEEAVGTPNVLLDVMKESTSTSNLLDNLKNKIKPQWVVQRSWPIALAIITIIIWFFCCWSAWPFRKCCRCCRCCAKTRKTMLVTKLFGLLLIVGLTIGVIVAAALAARGFRKARDGFQNMACTGGSLLDTILSGNANAPYFVGMLPLLKTFSDLDSNLEKGSPMMTRIDSLLDNTRTISSAVTVATSTLQLLSDGLNAPNNIEPKAAAAGIVTTGGSLHHKCATCQQISTEVLKPAIDTMNSGVGSALAGVRNEVNKQLSDSMRASLQSTLRLAVQPLAQLKDSIRQVFSFLLDTNKFKQVQDQISGEKSPVFGGVLGLVICAFLLLIFAFSSMFSFICCERCDKRAQNGQNPYCKSVHRIACCTWCCSFLYALIAFILGGVLYAASTPLGGMCLVMDDVSGDLVRDILPAIGASISDPDQEIMFGTIIDDCFTAQGLVENNNLLDVVFTKNSSGYKQTVNEQVKVSVKDAINITFATLTAKLSLPNVATDPNIVKLRNLLATTPMDAMIMPDPSYSWDTDVKFKDLASPLKEFSKAVSSRCADAALSESVPPPYGGQSVPGINNFTDKLSSIGTIGLGAPCSRSVTCAIGSPTSATCNAAKNYLDLKQQVRSAVYNCNLFENPSNPALYCDPKDMAKVGATWNNDCMKPTGEMKVKAQTCDLSGFVQYVQDFDTRINKVFARIDADTALVKDKINSDLRDITNTYILNPIGSVTDGVTCGFLAQTYRQTVDGLCYQAIWGVRAIGVSYVVCALLIAGLTIVTYALWRRAVDNVNSFALPQTE